MTAPTSNEVTAGALMAAIRSFSARVSAGPSGQRPDFCKQLVVMETSLQSHCSWGSAICWQLGGLSRNCGRSLGGAEGTALYKKAKDGFDDARPACSGETIRRVIGKALLATDIENLSSHLLPHCLAVGVLAGVEAMAHVTRQWRDDNANDNAKVLINCDDGNAHNEVDRHTFFLRMREVAPGLCKWLEFIYPTARHSFRGGQQGCPLIGACRALVKRMVHESQGLVAPLAGSQIPRVLLPGDLAQGVCQLVTLMTWTYAHSKIHQNNNNSSNNNNTIWGGSVFRKRGASSRHHISMEHRPRRNTWS